MRKLILLVLSICCCYWLVSASTIRVPSDAPAIQTGINASVDGDTVLVADGTYTGTNNMNLDFGGRDITVISENGPENCIINVDLAWASGGVKFTSGETSAALFKGFTIWNSMIDIVSGGIYISNSSPTIENCILWENMGWGRATGGGFLLENSDAIITNCTIYGNESAQSGGIFIEWGSPTIRNCIIANNTTC